jgi:hypothetical protein
MSWVELTDNTRKQASPDVVRDFGDHIKSAVNYKVVRDARRPRLNGAGRVGAACRLTAELAGLTPDANPLQFVQSRADYQYARALSESTTLTVDLATGARCCLYASSVTVAILSALRPRQGTCVVLQRT